MLIISLIFIWNNHHKQQVMRNLVFFLIFRSKLVSMNLIDLIFVELHDYEDWFEVLYDRYQ
jgi:hypothetical protein